MTKQPDLLRAAVLQRITTFPSAKAYADHIQADPATVSRFMHGHPTTPTSKMLADLALSLLTKRQGAGKQGGTKGTEK